VVGVVVRLEDVPDPDVVLVRELEVVLDLPLRVDDRRLACARDRRTRRSRGPRAGSGERASGSEPPAPLLGGGLALRRPEEVLERDVDEPAAARLDLRAEELGVIGTGWR
jgi:hypothetical protein